MASRRRRQLRAYVAAAQRIAVEVGLTTLDPLLTAALSEIDPPALAGRIAVPARR